MPNSNYVNGRAMEYKARQDLTEQGYTVIRAAGSKGKIDLCAINATEIRLIQVKNQRHIIKPDELKALQRLAVPGNASVEIWERVCGKWSIRWWDESSKTWAVWG